MPALSPDQIADEHLGHTLGIELEEVSAERCVMTMPVGPRVHQPLGYLHGGATVALCESVASIGGTTGAPEGYVCFGLEINANHLRPKQDGMLRAVGERLYAGRTTQVWQVRVTDERDKLICVCRCTLAVVKAGKGDG